MDRVSAASRCSCYPSWSDEARFASRTVEGIAEYKHGAPELFEGLAFKRLLLQPVDGPERGEYHGRRRLAHPRWRL